MVVCWVLGDTSIGLEETKSVWRRLWKVLKQAAMVEKEEDILRDWEGL